MKKKEFKLYGKLKIRTLSVNQMKSIKGGNNDCDFPCGSTSGGGAGGGGGSSW